MRTPHERAKNLFRVIVVAGAALTGGCSGDDDPGPTDAGGEMRDAVAMMDTGPGPMDSGSPGEDGGTVGEDAGSPEDAGEDGMVLIL